MRYQTVFLDAGGVLVYPNWQRAAETLARHGVSVAAAQPAAAEPAVKRHLDVAPTVSNTNDEQRGFLYFDLILERAGIPQSPATRAALAELKAFHDRENTWDALTDEVLPSLGKLRAAGPKIVIVSNTQSTLRMAFDRRGLTPLVDLIIASDEEGVEKPDPRLFRIALERSGSPPDATIHCGDMYEVDIVGARSAGLPAVLLDPANMYPEADCPRAMSLKDMVDGLLSGRFD